MKKALIVTLTLLLSINVVKIDTNAELPVDEFTHAVFGEEFTATWCVYCPSAAENLMKVYDDIPNEPYYHDKFFFVALITDVNDKADQRMDDYPDVTGYPTVIFDGNDEKVSGGQSDTSNYEQAVDNCGQRDDTDISLAIEMNHLGADQLEVSVKMTWNEDGTLGNPTFDGFIRAYIVEKESRYNNYDGDPYHFGFLDYAFEETVELEPKEEKMLYTVWTGGDHEDKNGNDFSDIDYENINIFVAFFNDESATTDKYVLETAFAIPPEMSVDIPEGLLSGSIGIEGNAISEKSEIENVYYRWDQTEWLDSGLSSFNGDFNFELDSTDLSNDEHQLDIKVVDRGASMVQTFNLEILNDENPPTLQIISPEEGETLESITIFEVEVIDDNQVSEVEYNVNQGDWRKMYYNEGDSYIASWNTQEAGAGNGEHEISFRAIDMNSNEISETIEINVLNEEDITYPYLRINEPEEDLYNNRVNINVKSSDPDGIEKVQYRIDNGTWRDLSSDGNDIFIETWTPTWDGWHWLDIRTVDNQEYETFQGIRFETDSTPPSLILNSLTNDITAIAEFDLQVYDYSNLQSIKYRIKPYGTIWQDWTELEQNGEQIVFGWDSTKYEDGECLLEIECTDEWGGVSTLYRNLDVKNQGLVYSIPPTNIETNTVTKITSIVDYENPVNVNMIVAKIDEDVLAEGQKIPMKKEGNYYIGELFFESSGNYVYSIEVDTGHGKLTSYEQNIIVSDKQIVSSSGEETNALVSTNIIPVIFILIIIVIRRK